LKDKLGRSVNKKGYLVTADGDTHDQLGNVMFEANLLDTEGDIPELFRLQVLRSDSQSSLSRLMGELDEGKKDEKSQKSQKRKQPLTAEVDHKPQKSRTQMPDHIDEESDQLEEMATQKKKRRRRQKPASTFIIEEVTDRDIRMASAYGGVAKPRLRKVKQRFNTVHRDR